MKTRFAGRRSPLPAGLALGLAGLLGLLTAPSASAVVLPTAWTVTASPMTLTEGHNTHVHVTVTGGTDAIGCVVVSVPSGFTVINVKVISVPTGTYWTASQAGAAPTTATFAASTSGALTLLATATFDVKVVATSGPLAAWITSAYEDDTCTTSAGVALLPLQPFVIMPAPTPTASATATPTPTPTPTPTATPTPTSDASPTLSPTPSPISTPTPRPSTTTPTARPATPDPTARPTPTPSASPSPSPSPTSTAPVVAGGGPVAGPPADGGATSGRGVTIGGPLTGAGLALGDLGSVDAFTFAWLVPGALLGLPAMLILLVLAAQVALGGLFVPLTRRVFADRGAGRPA